MGVLTKDSTPLLIVNRPLSCPARDQVYGPRRSRHGVGMHGVRAVFGVVLYRGSVNLQVFYPINHPDGYIGKGCTRAISAARVCVPRVESEVIHIVPILVRRILEVRRLCEVEHSVVVNVEEVAVPAARLDRNYPSNVRV